MTFIDYYKGLKHGQRIELARKMNVSKGFLSQLGTGHRKAGLSVLEKIERATNGAITRAEIRPDIFGEA